MNSFWESLSPPPGLLSFYNWKKEGKKKRPPLKEGLAPPTGHLTKHFVSKQIQKTCPREKIETINYTRV